MAIVTQKPSVTESARQVLQLAEQFDQDEKTSSEQLLKAIRRLHSEVEGPAHFAIRQRNKPLEFLCVLIAMHSGVMEELAKAAPKEMTASELAAATGFQKSLIVRSMRLLTSSIVFEETGPERYRANENALWLNQDGQRAGTDLVLVVPIGSQVDKRMLPGSPRRNGEQQMTPLQFTFGQDWFSYLRERPNSRKLFDKYMNARRVDLRLPWFNVFPAAEVLRAEIAGGRHGHALLTDVGGSRGHEILKFRDANQDIQGRFVLQDQPEAFSTIEGKPSAFEMVPYNFFQPQPEKGSRLYLFKAVCHDFTDEDCVRFLSNTAEAMDEHSSLLIDEWVLPDSEAPHLGASEDMMMLSLLSGMERTETQWRKILDDAGLYVEKIWPSKHQRESVIEAKRKPQ